MRKKQGRKPAEPSRKGNRFQVNVLLSVEMKNRVLAAARASGRSVSREAEHQLERALAVEDALAAMHTSFAEIQKGNFEAELWRRGYTPIRQPGHDWKHWKLWAEPGFPGVQPGGFEAWREGELEASLEQTAAIREAVGIDEAEIARRNAQALREADERPKWDADAAVDRLAKIEEAAGLAAPKKKDDAA
jgi:hypothetical protein